MDEIVKPYPGKIKLNPDKPVILIATKPDMDDFVKVSSFQKNSFTNLYLSRVYSNENLTVAGPFMGAPYAVMLLESLIEWGGKNFFFSGWTGSIKDDTKIGDVVIPEGAFCQEGTSSNYSSEKYVEADRRLTSFLENKLNDNGIVTKRRKIWTTDGVFRETMEKVIKYSSMGAGAVEMELSAILTVALFRGVHACSVQIVSDEIYTGKYITGHKNPVFKNSRMEVLKVLSSLQDIIY